VSDDNLETRPIDNEAVFGNWKEFKNRGNILIHKKRIQHGTDPAELLRSQFTIQCDASRVVGVLSNPRHFQLTHESFIDSKVLFTSTDSTKLTHSSGFNINKCYRSILVFQTKADDNNGGTMIVMRSIGVFKSSKNVLSSSNINKTEQSIDSEVENMAEAGLDDISVSVSTSTAVDSVDGLILLMLDSNIVKRKGKEADKLKPNIPPISDGTI
jgi:hypothetical protein